MVKMIHFADLHIGVETHGKLDSKTGINSRVLDFLARLDEMIDYGLQKDVDLVVFAGDAYKRRSPNPTYQRAFARRIKRLTDASVPVVLLVGNHDMPAMAQKASSLDIFHTLEVPHIIVGRTEKVHLVETKRGQVQVVAIPYPMRARLLNSSKYRGLSMSEVDEALRQVVCDNIAALKVELDPTLPAVLLGHFSVSGAVYGSEHAVILGSDTVVPKSVLADSVFDYVALGHIHKQQNLTADTSGVPPVVYSGSLERVDFGEERQTKGFCWVELTRGGTSWEFVPVNARSFVTIRADVRHAEDPTQTVLQAIECHKVQDAVVRLILETTPDTEAQLRDKEIEKALDGASYVAALVKNTERTERIRLGGDAPESMTPVELLERYLESQGTSTKKVMTLTEYANKIFIGEQEVGT